MLQTFGTIIVGSIAVIAASVAGVFVAAAGKGIYETIFKK